MVHVLDFFNGLFYAFSDFRERHRTRKYYQLEKAPPSHVLGATGIIKRGWPWPSPFQT